MGENWKKETKGNRLNVTFDDVGTQHTFVAGSKAMGIELEGLTWLNAEIEFADKTKAYGVVAISREDGGEHWATLVHLPGGGMAEQGSDDFLTKLGKTKDQVYGDRGYRYRYFPEWLRERDHHIDIQTGWSGRW